MTTRTRGSFVLAVLVVLSFGLLGVSCSSDGDEGGSGTTTTEASDGGGAGDAGEGEELYSSSCASCHGADATGLPNLGKDLTSSEFLKGLSDDEAVAFIKEGRPASDPDNTTGVDMPPKGGNPALSDDDIESIVAYLRTLES